MKTYKHTTEGSVKRRWFTPCTLFCLACILGGGSVFASNGQAGTYTDDEGRTMLRAELVEFEHYVESSMKAAREILHSRNVKAEDLKKLDAWQDAQLARFSHALRQQDALVALVDAWAVSESLGHYLDQQTSPEELPEATRDVALDMLKRREDRLVHIASRYLPKETLAALSHRIEVFTTEQSIPKGEVLQPDTRKWTAPLFSVWAKSQATVGNILQVPLMPGRALKGVSDSGKALAGIRETTADAVQVASRLPESIRTEFQIALADLVEKRAEIIGILSASDSVSTNLRATAESSHLTATEVQKSLTLARELAPVGESLADAVERAVNASTDLVNAIGNRSTPAAGESKAFDIAEYQRAADAITDAASEVHQMLVEIRGLIDLSNAPEKPDEEGGFDVREYGATADSIQRSAAEIRAQKVVNHLALRLIQVVAIGFLLACGHTWFRIRLARGKGSLAGQSEEETQ